MPDAHNLQKLFPNKIHDNKYISDSSRLEVPTAANGIKLTVVLLSRLGPPDYIIVW